MMKSKISELSIFLQPPVAALCRNVAELVSASWVIIVGDRWYVSQT